MNILGSGGAGYVGSHTARLLFEAGHDVWVYDNLSTGHAGAVPKGRLIEGALADRERLTATFKERRIEAVMHFAASALVGESVTDPAKYYQNNVVSTLSLFSALPFLVSPLVGLLIDFAGFAPVFIGASLIIAAGCLLSVWLPEPRLVIDAEDG